MADPKLASRIGSQMPRGSSDPHLIVDFFSLFQNCRLQGSQGDIPTVGLVVDILQSQVAALWDVIQGARRALQRQSSRQGYQQVPGSPCLPS